MNVTDFRRWHSSLPDHLQAYAKSLYLSGKAYGPHTADSLQLIHDLVTSKHKADKHYGSFTHD